MQNSPPSQRWYPTEAGLDSHGRIETQLGGSNSKFNMSGGSAGVGTASVEGKERFSLPREGLPPSPWSVAPFSTASSSSSLPFTSSSFVAPTTSSLMPFSTQSSASVGAKFSDGSHAAAASPREALHSSALLSGNDALGLSSLFSGYN